MSFPELVKKIHHHWVYGLDFSNTDSLKGPWEIARKRKIALFLYSTIYSNNIFKQYTQKLYQYTQTI